MSIIKRVRAPIRTELGVATKCERTGKWDISFVAFGGYVGEEFEIGETSCYPRFATEDEAYAGGRRAMKVLEETGKFPNLCEDF